MQSISLTSFIILHYYLEISFSQKTLFSLAPPLLKEYNRRGFLSFEVIKFFQISSPPVMASLVLLLLILAMANGSGATWCVCRSDLSDTVLQKTLDYACGAGADCTPLLLNGVCYQPNTVKAHCSYAANSYFQRKGQAQGTCDFANTAMVSTTDPSPTSTCVFPSSASTTNTTTSTPTATPTGGTSTGTTTPSSTTIGGTTGISPSGLTDLNGGAFHEKAEMGLIFIALWLSGLVLLRV